VFDLASVQAAIREFGFDGWLLYDFRGSNILAQRVADLAEKKLSRRWFLLHPRGREPKKLVHAIEPAALDHLPGKAKTGLSPLARSGKRGRRTRHRRQENRHGVLAAQRQPLHRQGRRRHHRTRQIVRRRDRAVRRLDPTVRSHLGRFSGAEAISKLRSIAARRTMSPSSSSPTRFARRGR